jgi:hypothetical protein
MLEIKLLTCWKIKLIRLSVEITRHFEGENENTSLKIDFFLLLEQMYGEGLSINYIRQNFDHFDPFQKNRAKIKQEHRLRLVV